ncbi:MAG TPA: NEW3 domain-containing protein [Actinocrinis sp.]
MRPTLRLAALLGTGAAACALAAGPLAAVPASAATFIPTTIYASPTGAGNACSRSAPCSLAGAQAAVETKNHDMSVDIDVYLYGGTYRLGSTLRFSPKDSGSNGHDVVWQALPGQQPVFSGAAKVTGFTEYDKSLGIWRAPISAAEATAGGQQLFVDGTRAELAQGSGTPAGLAVTATGFSTPDPSYAAFTNQSQIEAVDDNDWKHMSCPVQNITAAPGGGSDINILPSCWSANNTDVPNLGFPFNGSGLPAMDTVSFLENAYQLLTRPGQFYLDQSAHYLYYIPTAGQNMATADVELPLLQSLVTVNGTPGHLAPVNQNAPGASYSGSGWGLYTGRNLGDLGNDVEATQDNGDSVSYTFTGTGLEVLAETNSDEGSFDAYVDGKQDTSENFTEAGSGGGGRLAQQVVYSVQGLSQGTHTIELVKTGGTYFVVDGFETTPDPVDPARDIDFDGIAFEYSTWNTPETVGYIDNQAGVLWDTSGPTPTPAMVPAAVTVSRGSGIGFGKDAFAHLGATAVGLADGTQDSTISGSTVTDTAGGGVSVGEVDDYFQTDTALMTTGDTVAGNTISDVGEVYSDDVGIWAGYTRGLTVAHNDIGHTPYSGMSLGWGWGWASPCSMQAAQGLSDCVHGTNYAGGNRIVDNYIHDVMNVLFDGGPIYTNGGQGEDGASSPSGGPVLSQLSGNLVAIGNHTDNMLYQDEGSSYWDTFDNVVQFGVSNWIGMWTPTINNITVGPANYTDDPNYGINGTDIDFTQATVVSGGAWPAAAASIMQAAGPSPRPATSVYEDDNQALTYTGDWSAQDTASLADTHQTTDQGAEVSLSFTGSSIAFVTGVGPSGGEAQVLIDGKSQGDVSTYAAAPEENQTVFADRGLSPGAHTITVVDAGTTELTVGEFQTPALPYLSVQSSAAAASPGEPLTVTATLADPGLTPLLGATVSLQAPTGWKVSAPVALRTVPPGKSATATFTVTPPASVASGPAQLTAVASFNGAEPLVSGITVQIPFNSLAAAFDDVGISADDDTATANIDGSGYSLSATALAAAGATPGATVAFDGLTFTWPNAVPGAPDNVQSAGQEVPLTGTGTGTELGILDTATYGPASGTATVIYTDGSTQTFTLTVPDWYGTPAAGSNAVITTAYRNAPGNAQDHNDVNVYEQTIQLTAGKQAAAIILPDVSQSPTAGVPGLHVFALALGG